MTDDDVIAAIRKNHLKANISDPCIVRKYWELAWVDRGGGVFGPGPYVQLPVDWRVGKGRERVTIRVYPPERLRKRLAKLAGLFFQPSFTPCGRRVRKAINDIFTPCSCPTSSRDRFAARRPVRQGAAGSTAICSIRC